GPLYPPASRAAGRTGAGAPASEASNSTDRAAGRTGAGAPASEASNSMDRAAGRTGAGAPGVRGEQFASTIPSHASPRRGHHQELPEASARLVPHARARSAL